MMEFWELLYYTYTRTIINGMGVADDVFVRRTSLGQISQCDGSADDCLYYTYTRTDQSM